MEEVAIYIDGLHRDCENSLKAIYHLYNRKLLLFAKRYVNSLEVAEELVSDTFVKMWNNRYSFHTEDKLKAFLYICTKNACLNYLRKPNVLDSLDIILDTKLDLSHELDAFTKLVYTELIVEINKHVANLTSRQQAVFNMTYFEGLSTEEIAVKLNISADVVYSNRSRALVTLRNYFKGLEYDYIAIICLLVLT